MVDPTPEKAERAPTPPGSGRLASVPGRSIRHELRTPLNHIIGYSQILIEDAEESGRTGTVEDLRKIEAAGRRLLELIEVLTAEGPPATPPAGTTVARAAPAGPATAPEPPPAPPEADTPGRLLVVDDNEANRDVLARRLIRRGYEVLTAEGGHQALALLGERPFDLVLLDVMMPEISGLEVLKILRESRSAADLPVIMATARDASEDVVEALKLGANDYVTKPLDFAVVFARVETQLGLKKARDREKALNRMLEEAQEKIAKLSESSDEAVDDVSAWSERMAREVAGAIGATEIGVWALDGDELEPLAFGGSWVPDPEELRAARASGSITRGGDEILVPVVGLGGEAQGALVVAGLAGAPSVPARRILASFARQLGGALELSAMRRELAAASERQQLTRRQMMESGIELVKVCATCGTCYPQERARCETDARDLGPPRPLPYRVADRHRLLSVLGEGGMGTVYMARDERLDRTVAVKVVKAENFRNDTLRLRFDLEARAAARIEHPGVVAVFDSGELPDGSAFIVMERLVGSDLAHVMKRRGRGTPRQVAELLRQTGAALSAAHAAGLVHRDIKPENIFLTPAGDGFKAKILDFGLAKEFECEVELTQAGVIIGTPLFMSPEQLREKPADARSDLYSFAAVAFLALTGRRPTKGVSFVDVMVEVMQDRPPAVSDLVPGVPPEVDDAFRRALAKSPADRPASVMEWVDSIADHLAEVPSDVAGWIV